jgi:hypothetical protein
MPEIRNAERDAEIVRLRAAGWTLGELAERHCIGVSRVRHIVAKAERQHKRQLLAEDPPPFKAERHA